MQGQRSAIGSLPDSINFDYGSTSSNVGIDPQICWNNLRDPAEGRLSDYRVSASGTDTFMGTVSQEGRNLSRWGIGESSSGEPRNVIDLEAEDGWSSVMDASDGASGPRLEVQQYEPTNLALRNNVNLTLNTPQMGTVPPFVRCSNSGHTSQNYDLNVGILGRVGVDLVDCPNSSKSATGLENKLNPSASSSSDPFASSSGSGNFLVEDDDGRHGCSVDGRRLSCKRKAFEGNAGQASSSGTCFTRADDTMWQAVPPCYGVGSSMNVSTHAESSVGASPQEQLNPRLGLGMLGVTSDIQGSSMASGVESSQRSYRMRMNPSTQHDTIASNPLFTGATHGHAGIPPAHQPLRLIPVLPPLDLMSPVTPDNAAPQNQSVVLRVPPALRRHVHGARWTGASSSRSGSSSAVPAPGERDASLNDGLTSRPAPRNISEHPMFTPAMEVRNSSQTPTNWSMNGGNTTMSRTVASGSRAAPGSGSHSTSAHNWASQRHAQSQYSRRLSEYVRRSFLSSPGSETMPHAGNTSAQRTIPASAQAAQEGVLPSGSVSQGQSQPFGRSALWMERQGEGVIGIPYTLRTLAAAGEGRSRLVSEIRNVLDIMRRGEGLRFEDVMILDQTVLFGMADIHDQHRDMRLDVDNMSYEELLALEERIGYVCTGLGEETVLGRMKQRKYASLIRIDQTEVEPCCVCQEEYKDGEDVGTLDCGHDFHTECIKQWLAQKNLCPICKTTGLAT